MTFKLKVIYFFGALNSHKYLLITELARVKVSMIRINIYGNLQNNII